MAVALRCMFPGGYSGQCDGIRPIAEGAEVEVSEADARYLTSTFPGYFDRMARASQGSGSLGLLASPVRDILPAIRSGEYDGDIAALVAAEQAGAGRATVLSALNARARQIVSEGA